MAYKPRKSTKRPFRKYPRKTKGSTLGRLTKQVKNLQMMCKPEKKYQDVNQDEVQYLGQYAATVTDEGAFYAAINPSIVVGNGVSGRVGNKITLVSGYLQIQLRQMSSTINPVRYRYWVMNRKENTPSDIGSLSTFNDYFNTNPFSGVRDYFCNPSMETMRSLKVVARGQGIVRADPANTGQAMTAFIKRPLKLNLVQSYDNANATVTNQNKLYLFVQCDNGQIGTNTGLQMLYTCRFWYTDM